MSNVYEKFVACVVDMNRLNVAAGGEWGEISISKPLFDVLKGYVEATSYKMDATVVGFERFQVTTPNGIVEIKIAKPIEKHSHPVTPEDWARRRAKTKKTEIEVKNRLKNPADRSFMDELKTI